MADLQYVKGLDAIKAALNALPRAIGKNVLRTAVSRGAAIIKDRAVELAPSLQEPDRHKGRAGGAHWNQTRVKGMLKAAIYQKVIAELSNDFVSTTYVGVREGKQQRGSKYQYVVQTTAGAMLVDAFYWKWIEFGHFYMPPRPINSDGKRAKQSFARDNFKRTGAAVWVEAKPFMRPAFNDTKDQAVKAIVDYMKDRIPREAKKLGLKTK